MNCDFVANAVPNAHWIAEAAESREVEGPQDSSRQQAAQPTHIARPCCSQGYGHCPRAHRQPLPLSRPLCQLCACRHQQPPARPALPCAMPRTRPKEPPTLQRTVQERDWVLRRVEVCGPQSFLRRSTAVTRTCACTTFSSFILQFPVAYAKPRHARKPPHARR